MKTNVEIHSDGSCLSNPGPGGYAALLRTQGKKGFIEKTVVGSKSHTTNNEMELMGAIKGFETLKRPCKVTLFSDSQYVLKGITDWHPGWIKRGWKNAAGKAVANKALWQQLIELVKKHEVKTKWIKGHSGHEMNEIVDQLAFEAAQKEALKIKS